MKLILTVFSLIDLRTKTAAILSLLFEGGGSHVIANTLILNVGENCLQIDEMFINIWITNTITDPKPGDGE